MTILNTEKILVANFFRKNHLEKFLGQNLTDNQYQKIVDYWNEKGLFDKISSLIKEWIIDNIKGSTFLIEPPNECKSCDYDFEEDCFDGCMKRKYYEEQEELEL